MRKTIAYARKMRSQPRQAKSPPHCAAGSTESKVNTTTATPTPEALAIAVIFKDFEIDHTPDGWPAVKQMHLSAAAAELERQHAEIEALKAERARSGLAHRKAVQAAVAEAVAAEREACAEIAADEDNIVDVPGYYAQLGDAKATARNIEKAIRARGTP